MGIQIGCISPAVLLDEVDELICGCDHGDASAHDLLAHIQINLARGSTNISKICTSVRYTSHARFQEEPQWIVLALSHQEAY